MDASDSRTMRERMLAGELYLADDPELGATPSGPQALTTSSTRWTRHDRARRGASC